MKFDSLMLDFVRKVRVLMEYGKETYFVTFMVSYYDVVVLGCDFLEVTSVMKTLQWLVCYSTVRFLQLCIIYTIPSNTRYMRFAGNVARTDVYIY